MQRLVRHVSFLALLAPSPSWATEPGTRMELKSSPLVDMHYWLRKLAEDSSNLPKIEGLEQALTVVREVDKQLPNGWGLLDPAWLDAADIAAALAISEKMPAEFRDRSGKTVPLRDLATRLAKAYAPIEKPFLESIWPKHKATIDAARDKIEHGLLPKQEACFADLCEHLNIRDPKLTIPMYLVVESPRPGAFTYRERGGGAVSVVCIGSMEGSTLYEITLHETIHALDNSSQKEDTAFTLLRRDLLAAGLTEQSRAYHDVPHTLMFVQAAETIRRKVDPDHKHYGDTHGYYGRIPKATQAVREPWMSYLEDKTSREKALAEIVERAKQQKE